MYGVITVHMAVQCLHACSSTVESVLPSPCEQIAAQVHRQACLGESQLKFLNTQAQDTLPSCCDRVGIKSEILWKHSD